jgi:CRP/FNR family transcriptional regulator
MVTNLSRPSAEIKTFLGNTSLFQTLNGEQLEFLGAIATVQTYAKGEMIFAEGDPATGFFIVKSGRVKVFKLSADGKEQILHVFAPEDHFAEVPAFDGQCFPASAATLEPTELLSFPRPVFLELLQQHPSLSIAILGTFARHLRRLAHLVDTLSFKEVPERLAAYLLGLSDRLEGTDHLDLDLTKGQLAALLGTIPETLSRAFYRLSQAGAIATDGTKIQILDRASLTRLAKVTD